MKELRFCVIVLVLFSACMTQKEIKKVSFTHVASNQYQQKEIRYTMQVPKGYKLERVAAGGEAGEESKYVYPDSSLLYISDFGGTPNADNIKREGYDSKKFEFKMKQDALNGDTLILSGQDEKGLYWKEIMIGKLEVGYLKVPLAKKKLFDEALESVKK